MNASFHNSLFMIIMLLCSGCYEGFDRDRNDPPPIDPPDNGGNSNPAFDYILYQAIYLSPDAMTDTDCFPNSAVTSYRSREWDFRIAAIAAALKLRTNKLVQNDIIIEPSDCTSLTAIIDAASSPTPWGSADQGPESNSTKPVLHVKAVFWGEAQQAQIMPSLANEWDAWQDFKNTGLDTRSFHHFVVDGQKTGFIQEWLESLEPTTTHSGTFIRDIDPTDAGIASRNQIISSDTSAFMGIVQ